jgi:hypothetical protein
LNPIGDVYLGIHDFQNKTARRLANHRSPINRQRAVSTGCPARSLIATVKQKLHK